MVSVQNGTGLICFVGMMAFWRGLDTPGEIVTTLLGLGVGVGLIVVAKVREQKAAEAPRSPPPR